MPRRILPLIIALLVGDVVADDRSPHVAEGFVVDVVATEPYVRNPCAMAFDRYGRICVGQGPQYRNPRPDTPGDRVDILLDTDNDGRIDGSKTFARGFNCIQGLAWNGHDLWVANAPDLTLVRDTDGDDVADVYIRVYTDLGNLEHGLHGLNFAPDGRLYMSKGNSRGQNRTGRVAPAAFRELWGMRLPDGESEPKPVQFTAANYEKNYHDPSDDWGQQGGVLRCNQDGSGLEIVSRGNRNPWDITYDSDFNWLGTDNDQTQGDKIFSPFYGAHFGWGHTWSYHWTGTGHLPTVPASADLFEGSGTGVTFYSAHQFPEQYQNVFLINDWLGRTTSFLRPAWDGALMSQPGKLDVLAHAGGGRAMAGSSGLVYDPTDLEVGPDGGVYVLSWGRSYGAEIKEGKQVNIGRVYRIRWAGRPLVEWKSARRAKRLSAWTLEQLYSDLTGHMPTWRTNAQNELVRRGNSPESAGEVIGFLRQKMEGFGGEISDEQASAFTWTAWTVAQLRGPEGDQLNSIIYQAAGCERAKIQALRIAGFRAREYRRRLPEFVQQAMNDGSARVRHAVVQACWQARSELAVSNLLGYAAKEPDRVVFYSLWNAARSLVDVSTRKSLLKDNEAGIRLAVLLGLMEDQAITADEVLPFRRDPDERIAELAEMWLQKTGGAEPIVQLSPPPGEYPQPVTVQVKASVGGTVLYSLDGSTPEKTSASYRGPVTISKDQVLSVAVQQGGVRVGPVIRGKYTITQAATFEQRPFVTAIHAESGARCAANWKGLGIGQPVYTDRRYVYTDVPSELAGMPYLMLANNDEYSHGDAFLTFVSDSDVRVFVAVDQRVSEELDWMKIGQSGGFEQTALTLRNNDSLMRVFVREFEAGKIALGGNANDPKKVTPRGNYAVILDRPLLGTPGSAATTADVMAALPTADPARGRELFLHPRGAGCIKCHFIENQGRRYAPDLSDIGLRAKPEVLIQSILQPSAIITEGFAQQQIVTAAGKVLNGAVLEETGLSLKLVDPQGVATVIRKADIEERTSTKLSPMPAGFEKLLTAQQLADVVAWLQTQKSKKPTSNGFSFSQSDDELVVWLDGKRITTWLKRHPELTRPAFVNVHSHTGIQVTRKFPADDNDDHRVMHPGIWVGFGDLNGNDYWRLKARVQFKGFPEGPVAKADSAMFMVTNDYLSEQGDSTVCTEITRYRFQRVPEGIQLHIHTVFESDDHDFYFGDQEESGLAIRTSAPLRVDTGNGAILNDSGDRDGKQVRGKFARWFDYYGTVDNRHLGIMVAGNPRNPKTSWLHARDYGLVATNPFPMQPKERREPYVKTWVKKGQPFALSWCVLIHDTTEPIDRDAVYQRMLKGLK